MSLRLSTAQFDSSFRPSSLCNWEVPRDPSPITRAASPGPTKFVVGDNGHLVRALLFRAILERLRRPRVPPPRPQIGKKTMNSFGESKTSPSAARPAIRPATYGDERWPAKKTTSADTYGGAATMGFKGIATTYLPSSTVYLKDGSGSFTYN